MSTGVFGLLLAGVLVVMCRSRRTRIRTVFTAAVALMLGVVIAGGEGVLGGPSRDLVDGVRLGLTSVGRSIGGWFDGSG